MIDRWQSATILLSAVLLLASCTNHYDVALGNATAPINNVGVAGAISNTSNEGSKGSAMVLAQVLRNSINPNGQFDLIGDGTGSMGSLCLATGITASSQGTSSCSCTYDYIKSDGSSERVETDTDYHESDLIRCSTTVIPAGLSYVTVSVHLVTQNTYSNAVTFRYVGGSTGTDLSNPNSFSMIRRFQCRDAVVVKYQMDTNMYDPILSEDPAISYPLNFYTANMGAAFANFIGNAAAAPQPNGAGWYCPPTPNDAAEGMDLTIFSRQALDGSKQIYPATGSSFDRSTFYLAKVSSGVFSVPVNVYEAPNTRTVFTGSTTHTAAAPPPIGYGAVPITAGDEEETCPGSNVTIPANYHWVKVWQFRASLEDRKIKTSPAIQALGAVYCNPGVWTVAGGFSAGSPQIIRDCGNTGGKVASSTGDVIADRILGNGTNACLQLEAITPYCTATTRNTGVGCTTSADGVTLRGPASPTTMDYRDFAPGTDVWLPRKGQPYTGAAPPPALTTANDTLNLLDPSRAAAPAPHDPNPGIASVDGGISRFDYLLVVSPQNVMTKDFKNGTAASLPFTPYRYYSSKDCQSPDPDNPLTVGDCPSNRQISYGFKFHDVNTNGDAPAGDPGRLPVFPVCALQPN